jgi:hypothetical protein
MSANQGLSTEDEIRKSILRNLPIAFGEAAAVEAGAVIAKFNELLDYASAVSAPFLGPDTIRYQTMLLTLSLFLMATSVFRFTAVKLFDVSVQVGGKFFVLYSALIAAVAAIFAVKSFVDHERARFIRMKNFNVKHEFIALITLSLDLKDIQDYFWLEIFDAIGRAYDFYSSFASAVVAGGGSSANVSIPMQVFNLDRAALAKVPQKKIELDRLDRYRQKLCDALERDKARFRKDAEAIVEAYKKQDHSDPSVVLQDHSYDDMEKAYQSHLQKWFDVRNELVDRKLDVVDDRARLNEESRQAEGIEAVLRKIMTIRTVYAICEITAPIVFAAASILLVVLR